MVVKGYTVAQLFLCQLLKTGRFLVLKLTKSENTSWCTKLYPVSLVKCTLRSVPSSDSTQWNIYLRAPEQAGWTGGAHTPTWASKHEKNFPGGLGDVLPGSLIMWIIIHVVSAVLNDQKREYLKEGPKERGGSHIYGEPWPSPVCSLFFASHFCSSFSDIANISTRYSWERFNNK